MRRGQKGIRSTSFEMKGHCEISNNEDSGPVARSSCQILGTTSVQLRERKNSALAPQRHQLKHLKFSTLIVRDPGGRRFKSSLPDAIALKVKQEFAAKEKVRAAKATEPKLKQTPARKSAAA